VNHRDLAALDQKDFSVWRGDSIQLKGQVVTSTQNPGHYAVSWYRATGQDQIPDGYSPANITGFFAWFTLKYETPDPDNNAVCQVTTGTGAIIFVQPLSGIFTINVPASVTQPFPDGKTRLVADFQIQDLLGNITTPDRRRMEVVADVTRTIQQVPPVAPIPYPAMPEGFITLTSVGAFGGFNAGALPDGSLAYIPGAAGAFGQYFVLLSQSTQAIDGTKCFQANPAGRWRLLTTALA
jgi:hypothetical protein